MPEIDLGSFAAALVDWMQDSLQPLFDTVSSLVSALVEVVTAALAGPPALVTIAVLVALAVATRRPAFIGYAVLSLLLINAMGLWTDAMHTLALVLVAAVVALMIGIPLGIVTAYSRTVAFVVRPMLDLAQTMPVFVYLIPAVFLFGIGATPGVVATIVFAVAPAVRLTELGIREVDPSVVEAAVSFGAGRWQILTEVHLPLAMRSIMTGVNQVIMMSLSMVVIAGMVGADGLGELVVQAVSSLDVAGGFQSGLAVVLLAIYLDRLSGSVATSPGGRPRGTVAGLLGRRGPTTTPDKPGTTSPAPA
ncbi:ABC transporter permease [Pseudonocardia sp. C8]|uniref:ABC transporter permease n=1 Tax=Pseudonocardia sp. C8 TaxID=2762759 RepID=UPI00351C5C4F